MAWLGIFSLAYFVSFNKAAGLVVKQLIRLCQQFSEEMRYKMAQLWVPNLSWGSKFSWPWKARFRQSGVRPNEPKYSAGEELD